MTKDGSWQSPKQKTSPAYWEVSSLTSMSETPLVKKPEDLSLNLQNKQMTDTVEYYDDGAFMVITTRFGLYSSRDRDGQGITCGLDKEAVIFWSREHLNGFQNSWVSNTGVNTVAVDL